MELTFKECAERYIKAHKAGLEKPCKHAGPVGSYPVGIRLPDQRRKLLSRS